MSFQTHHHSLAGAQALDQECKIRSTREDFSLPPSHNGKNQLYFAGHSLGLMPKKARTYIEEELQDWERFGVEGHFHARHPWLPYHEFLTPSFAKLVGAKETEVVAMNTLTVNLHLALVSFYQPNGKRRKILIENNTFPSDKYAVDSQAQFHGLDPADVVVQLKPRAGQMTVSTEDIIAQIEELGDELALVMLGNCNYLSGQCFPFAKIVEAGHRQGAKVGFNLAHGAGNLKLELHDWNVDFAVWCSYKYLNSGPGGLAGSFFHEKHCLDKNLKRFAGWWGHNKQTRFQMGPHFDALPTAEAWSLSNPPIFQLASLRASMEIFDRVGMTALREKGDRLTSYLEWRLLEKNPGLIEIVTPAWSAQSQNRGSMICVKVKTKPQHLLEQLKEKDVILDFREPDILRITPAPLYNTYEDVFHLTEIIHESLKGQKA